MDKKPVFSMALRGGHIARPLSVIAAGRRPLKSEGGVIKESFWPINHRDFKNAKNQENAFYFLV
jgi:hypothetical protein